MKYYVLIGLMYKKLNIVGEKYNLLTVIKEIQPQIAPSGNKSRRYLCKCDCGNTIEANQGNLRSNRVTSCGCHHKKRTKETATKHGMRNTKEYAVWASMKRRCYTKSVERYSRYGGRGIKVCDRWKDSFENFYADMGAMPSPSHTIERRNVNGDYEPSNCYWLEGKLQYKTRSSTKLTDKLVKYIKEQRGLGRSGTSLAKELNVHSSTIYNACKGKTWKDQA